MRKTTCAMLAGVVMFGALGCSGKQNKAEEPPKETAPAANVDAAPEESAEPAPKPTISYDKTSPTGTRMAWVIDVINNKKGVVEVSEIEANVDKTMLDVLPAPKLQEVFAQVASQLAPMRPIAIAKDSPTNLVLRVATKQPAELFVVVNVTQAAPHKIDGLLFQPAPTDNAKLPTTWDGVLAGVKQTASKTQLYAARIDPKTQTCTPVKTHEPDLAMALGSTFKLYILTTLADQIAAGKHTWDEQLAIEDAKKSLPSGKMQDEAAGATFPLEHFARLMISISDNTATDHLLALAGRENVEATVAATKHHDPAKLAPFLSTREMFTLKLARDDAQRDAYVAMDAEARRAELAKMASEPLPALENAMGWSSPRYIDSIEWFATGEDLCKLQAHLVANKDNPAHARALEVMAVNPGGLEATTETWTYIGYKGGSEPGVAHLSYLLQRKDGAWFSLVIAGNDTKEQVPVMPLIDMARASSALLLE